LRSRWLSAFLLVCLALLLLPAFFSFNNIGGVEAQTEIPPVNPEPSTVATITGPPIIFEETSDYIRLNFTMFIFEFYKSGYEVIYAKDGSVLVYYHSMVLQYYNEKVKDWRQTGTFAGLSWTKNDDYHYQVTKSYEDASTSPKTNYTITYDIRSDSRVKITIGIESGADRQYRLHWSLDGIVYSDWKEKKNSDNVKHRLCFGDDTKDYGWIAIDWQDIYEQFRSDISSYSVSTSAKGRKADVYFDLGTTLSEQLLAQLRLIMYFNVNVSTLKVCFGSSIRTAPI